VDSKSNVSEAPCSEARFAPQSKTLNLGSAAIPPDGAKRCPAERCGDPFQIVVFDYLK
jgi:hypothetical protein